MSVNQINIEAVNKRTRERKHTNLWNEVYKGKKQQLIDQFQQTAQELEN